MSQLTGSIVSYVVIQNKQLRRIKTYIRNNDTKEAIKLIEDMLANNKYLIDKMISES